MYYKFIYNYYLLYNILYPQFSLKIPIHSKYMLTVNSPVWGSKPTWTVCSKLDGGDMTGLSLVTFMVLLPVINNSLSMINEWKIIFKKKWRVITIIKLTQNLYMYVCVHFYSLFVCVYVWHICIFVCIQVTTHI